MRVVYLFTHPATDQRVELQLRCDPTDPHVPSLAGQSFASGRFEREMRDLFGIVPDDHPMPAGDFGGDPHPELHPHGH
jgi:Ni,Fe-hydrogenase III component G